MIDPLESRRALTTARRIVIKVGTNVLVHRTGRPNERRLGALVDQIARRHAEGRELVLVTSGAIGAGMEALGMTGRPTALPDLQMAAAVGQSRLMTRYTELFASRRCQVGQILLTHDDLKHRLRHLNARNTMMNLLRHRIIPVVNENDVVAVDEIKFGDNDQLASLVTMLVEAELLILLTSVDGLRAPGPAGRMRRVPHLPRVDEEALALAWGKAGPLSVGGMGSKLKSAQAAAEMGASVVIADGRRPDAIDRVLAGEDVGTLIGDGKSGRSALSGKKRWIAFFNRPQGALVVDEGARRALVEGGKSLLAIGITGVEGNFEAGAVVAVKGPDGTAIARGLVEYSGEEARRIQGRRSARIAEILGERGYDEVIHRDNLVVLK